MDSEIKEEIPVHDEYVLCGGAETCVLKCGPWTDLFNDQSASRPKLLIFIIPGNPGLPAFYVPFAKALYSSVNRRFPVWVISHAGHVLAPQDKKILTTSDDPNAQEIKDIYGLRGQIEHKITFLRTHVPKETKLVVIGHSVGSYISLQILKHAPELPLTFYYGAKDAWCPKEYYEDIKKDFPEGDIRLCEKKIPHAFILYSYQEMADMVADWLKDDLSKIETVTEENQD
ncbi:lipid droplet-associated hydrolase isoform X4 [Pteropus alecto]|uniref:lipid droplet-associated hydrolase isoform X4 n=1 Tax=Pteropus alecto TaxID=9402 RepID=UPI000D53BBA9|nr:lipid droplet-associated hydrolase isoform X4 [Pteropus alecto]